MPGWQTIDGFLKEEDANHIGSAVRAVGEHGWIIEIGCFKGRQSRFIAENKKESVMLSCIDPFPDKLVHFDDSRTYQNYMFHEWQQNLEGFKNVEAVRSISPFNISYISFAKVPDVVIFDVDEVYKSLQFWLRFSDKNTQFIVHTYRQEHTRISDQLTQAQTGLGLKLEYRGSLAILRKEAA